MIISSKGVFWSIQCGTQLVETNLKCFGQPPVVQSI